MTPPVHLVPLGGLGEIGMNCMGIACDGDRFLLDCGVTFADRAQGVDLIHPDLGWALEDRKALRALLLTHGHEDHIGAIPYLLREVDVPVYGPPYALALVRRRLEEHELDFEPRLLPTEPGRAFTVGSLTVEPFRVNHSIPDATGLILRTPQGVLVHSGDFKIDDRAPDGERFARDTLRALGDAGVRLLLSDSTNIDVEGTTGAEVDVAEELMRRVRAAPQRVVVALFASNVDRARAAIDCARATGRRVCLLGRSVSTHSRVATELGLLDHLGGLLVPPDKAQGVPPDQLLVVATGTQAEPPAALPRLARGEHPALALDPGDQVILSSRIIPGCERAVWDMIADLERRGVVVHQSRWARGIHVSGHACRDEQAEMIQLTRPATFLPVHGTYHHLKRHAELARALGVDDTLVVENGMVVEVGDAGVRVVGRAEVGRVHIDRGEPLDAAVLSSRRLLGELGYAVIVVCVDRDLRPRGLPQVLTRGFVNADEEEEFAEEAADFVARELRRMARDHADLEDVRDHARRALKRFCGRWVGRKPLVEATVVET